MSTVVITPPADPVVSLAEAKRHVRAADFNDDDDYLESLVAAATGVLDGPAGWLGRALVEQVLEWRGDEFGSCDIPIFYPPIVSIDSVKYDDSAGVEQTLTTDYYRLVGLPSQPRVALSYGSSWPSVRWQSESVRIQYTAGYGDPEDVPAPIRQAILLHVGWLYENRESATLTTAAFVENPAYLALLSPYRIIF